MGWGNKRHWVLALAVMCGAWGASVMPALAADTGNLPSEGREGGVRFGIDREEYDAQARAAMQVDPVVAAHLGAIRKISLDDAASMDEPGPDVLVFDVEGSRGKGRVTARFITVSATQEALGPGVLVMADGTEHAITGSADALAAEDGSHDHHHHDHDEDVEAGAGLFIQQAREAAQRYPVIQQHIGRISTFEIDSDASGAAPGMNAFVFDVVGDKGRGRLEADFITVSAATERLGKGVLTLVDGRRVPFDGEPRGEDEFADHEGAGALFGDMQDNIFTRQARVAVQRSPLVQEHIGTLTAFDFDLAGTGKRTARTSSCSTWPATRGTDASSRSSSPSTPTRSASARACSRWPMVVNSRSRVSRRRQVNWTQRVSIPTVARLPMRSRGRTASSCCRPTQPCRPIRSCCAISATSVRRRSTATHPGQRKASAIYST